MKCLHNATTTGLLLGAATQTRSALVTGGKRFYPVSHFSSYIL